MSRGRPASTAPAWEFHLHLRLRVGTDDDLIVFLRKIPPRRRASAIKSALRAGGIPSDTAGVGNVSDELFTAIDNFLK
jgi:hypothetical protein